MTGRNGYDQDVSPAPVQVNVAGPRSMISNAPKMVRYSCSPTCGMTWFTEITTLCP